MNIQGVTPILNVSSLEDSFAWFEQLGWRRLWDWGDGFGAVKNGNAEIFLCTNGQGSRTDPRPEQSWNHTGATWMSWWLSSPDEVDALHKRALELGIIVTWPPTDMEWGVRECHIRHPDGHTFRVSANRKPHGH
jgi:catechol 2,3-dioxygenase-like lactoylglutathione lyase family enzyme